MTKKCIFCLLLALLTALTPLGLFPVSSASSAESGDYIRDGLFAWYNGEQNTREGQNLSSSVWQDLVGGYDLPITRNDTNYFTEEGLRVNGKQHYFPDEVLNLVNESYFTIEIEFGDFAASGTNYNVFMNSGNDHFSLFRRVSKDVIEWKFGNNHSSVRPTISQSMRYIPHHVLTFTCEYGGDLIMYVNGVEMARAECDLYMGADNLFIGQNKAERGYDALYKNIRFYSRPLTAEEVAHNVRVAGYDMELDESVSYVDHVTIAQPQTRITGDVAMVRPVGSTTELDAMMKGESLPAVAVYEINEKLEVLDENGAPFSTVEEVLAKTKYQILSCFSIRDNPTASALAKYLNTIYFFDVQIMSADKNVLKYAREYLPSCYGILDLRAEYEKVTDLSEEQLLDIRRAVKANNGYVAVLPVALCCNEDVQYLYDRQVNVWAWGSDTPDVTEQYYALLSGAIGVVSDATDSYLDIACNKLARNTVTRAPANTGHRGLPSQAPECTLEGSILAYEQGANVIEMDVYLTTDGHVVAMHDGTTGRTCNRNLNVEESTLAELKQLYVNKGYENHATYSRCRIPTLGEYLEWFKGKDCLFFIEIKSGNTDIVTAIKKLIDKYDMYGQCTVITFNENIMAAMHEKYPEMPVGCLNGVGLMSGNDSDADMPTVMNSIGRYNGTHNPSYESYTALDLRACLLRGFSVYPWTIAPDSLSQYYVAGFGGLTNDYANRMGYTTYSIELTEEPTFQLACMTTLDLRVTNYAHSSTAQPATDIILLEGSATLRRNTITPTAAGELSFIVAHAYKALDRVNCVMYTQPIMVTITDPNEPQETETESVTAPITEDTESDAAELPDEDDRGDRVETESTSPTEESTTDASVTTVADTTSATEKKGCGSTVISSVSILVILIAAAVCVVKTRLRRPVEKN